MVLGNQVPEQKPREIVLTPDGLTLWFCLGCCLKWRT